MVQQLDSIITNAVLAFLIVIVLHNNFLVHFKLELAHCRHETDFKHFCKHITFIHLCLMPATSPVGVDENGAILNTRDRK